MDNTLTISQLLASASEILALNGYSEVPNTANLGGLSFGPRIFEDAYGVVAVYAFETWRQLVDQWHIAQGQLVDLISMHLRTPEPKAWDGYLVLLTPTPLPPTDRVTLNDIRNDITRVRKLVATGDDLATLEDVRSSILPLLLLGTEEASEAPAHLLNLLPDLLSEEGVSRAVTQIVVKAFTSNDSILERLHESRSSL